MVNDTQPEPLTAPSQPPPPASYPSTASIMEDTLLFPPHAGNSISSASIGTSHISSSGVSSMSPYGDGAVVAKVASPVTSSTGAAVKRRNQLITPEMAYASATKPFSYADGYHYLINYVRQKMSQEDLMRISRALALFRPSVLASMMNLTEDDLVFTEKCLQRTLLEYEKLISYSGTPTVVWRRTGEIALVGKEFSLLTQWSRDALLNKKTYIYELMSNASAVEYWEKYALHAFDNTDSAVYSSCILISPTKRLVPCTFCFTIKRDIFDLPSVIVGNFLPILS
ncbi:Transcriptional regulator of nonfermentable carbon utilization [Apophysomyces sp. BC1021]|nr:Transcriptional regulator of nonfermentable carbon utilization [Apophysomyces sp. BC1021]